jgi:hypothetical protein
MHQYLSPILEEVHYRIHALLLVIVATVRFHHWAGGVTKAMKR